MADSICARCFHNYVCEQFNENRDYKNQECRYFNSHFVDVDSVEPVRHGHWTDDNGNITDQFRFNFKCSECNEYQYSPILKTWSSFTEEHIWCHNCGAKMDEEEPK